LTLNELKDYVDRTWPGVSVYANDEAPSLRFGAEIRYLLARRLTREMRATEAREYFPAEWQSRLDELIIALNDGWNESTPIGQRAKSLFAAAWIARTNGRELLGTELAPDWFIHGGDYDWGLTRADRETNGQVAVVNIPTAIELQRASEHHPDPEARFHYRYQAAFLAREAAKLMPNNSDETARVLCVAGTWLKRRDPETADIFYKDLVRRCRKTLIGEQADRMRWFPVLDENGNPRRNRRESENAWKTEPTEEADALPSEESLLDWEMTADVLMAPD
jgi:hypothetical protein